MNVERRLILDQINEESTPPKLNQNRDSIVYHAHGYQIDEQNS